MKFSDSVQKRAAEAIRVANSIYRNSLTGPKSRTLAEVVFAQLEKAGLSIARLAPAAPVASGGANDIGDKPDLANRLRETIIFELTPDEDDNEADRARAKNLADALGPPLLGLIADAAPQSATVRTALLAARKFLLGLPGSWPPLLAQIDEALASAPTSPVASEETAMLEKTNVQAARKAVQSMVRGAVSIDSSIVVSALDEIEALRDFKRAADYYIARLEALHEVKDIDKALLNYQSATKALAGY